MKKLIREFIMDCPICGKSHTVQEYEDETNVEIKNDEVKYREHYFYCVNANEDEHKFVNGQMMNKNMQNARNAYRIKHGLLTSDEIVEIRKKYNLSQIDFSRLLGWGDVTITRYETKAIQDKTYDTVLKKVRDDTEFVAELLKQNSEKLSAEKRQSILEKLSIHLNKREENKRRNSFTEDYFNFNAPSKLNGFTALNIDKIEAAASYIAEHVSNLFKVKLMKMLWYTDNLSYQKYQHSITGMVYTHENMGALPVGHRDLMMLPGLNVVEEMSANYDSMFHVYPNPDVNYDVLTSFDKRILDAVIQKFKNFSTKEIVDYMHEETAYTKTITGEAISFDFANELRPF